MIGPLEYFQDIFLIITTITIEILDGWDGVTDWHHYSETPFYESIGAYMHLFICVCVCVWLLRSTPGLTSPTCDTQRGSDLLTPAGTHTPLVLIDFGFMLTAQMQNGNRKKKSAREREKKKKKTERKKINIKQRIIEKNSSHVLLLPVNNKRPWMEKRDIPGF